MLHVWTTSTKKIKVKLGQREYTGSPPGNSESQNLRNLRDCLFLEGSKK